MTKRIFLALIILIIIANANALTEGQRFTQEEINNVNAAREDLGCRLSGRAVIEVEENVYFVQQVNCLRVESTGNGNYVVTVKPFLYAQSMRGLQTCIKELGTDDCRTYIREIFIQQHALNTAGIREEINRHQSPLDYSNFNPNVWGLNSNDINRS
jgi:hypothetical protein